MSTQVAGRKRIIVCCDGTWMDSDGEYQVPSNVTRIARAITPLGKDDAGNDIPQIIFYQNGVGTGSNSLYVKYVGGATGGGLAEHIREAYSFICQNYIDGDEIFLIGFSRGAFTARSISSVIRALGLLTSKGLENFASLFEDWQHQLDADWKTKYPNYPWPGHRPPVSAPDYQRKMLELELTRPNIPIKAVAVWDTVGGLGIPMIGLLPQPPSTEFAFVDTKVEPNIEYAFQALALDEHRRAYSPTIWEKPDGQEFPRKLKQTWFPGVHSDIGGSYLDADLADVTLCWMVSQLDPFVTFEHHYIWSQVRMGIEKHGAEVERLQKKNPHLQLPVNRPWGLGKIHNSMSFFFRLGGSKTRTPGEYTETERAAQHGTLWWIFEKICHKLLLRLGFFQPKPMPRLKNTNETFHSSVRIRMGKNGKGYDDKGRYDSEALQGWVMEGDLTQPDTPWQKSQPGQPGSMRNVVWRKKVVSKKQDPKTGTITSETQVLGITEDVMGAFERKILQLWPEIDKDFDVITPGGHEFHTSGRSLTDPAQQSNGINGARHVSPPPPVPMLRADGGIPERRRSRSRRRESADSQTPAHQKPVDENADSSSPERPERAETY
jgi:hypothetical protein